MAKPTPQIEQLRRLAQGKDVALRRWAIGILMDQDPEWLKGQKLELPKPPEGTVTPPSRPATPSEAIPGVSEAIWEKTAVLLSVVNKECRELWESDLTPDQTYRKLADRLMAAANDLVAAIQEAEALCPK